MGITFADGFDELDQQYADSIVPEDVVFVTQMITVISWMNEAGERGQSCYATTGGEATSTCLGMLELAKVDLMKRGGVVEMLRSDDD